MARKLSQQMVDEASTPFTSALASALTDSADAAKNVLINALLFGDFSFSIGRVVRKCGIHISRGFQGIAVKGNSFCNCRWVVS